MMHIFSMKSKTKQLSITDIPDAPVLYLPLLQHIGQAAKPIVKVGEYVLKYQIIAEETRNLSANVHAPVSGTIKAIELHPLADGTMVETIVLENDFRDEEFKRPVIDADSMASDEILTVIKAAGIVGEGGAQFPTFVKYNLLGKKINTFIVNGTECEPYLTADYVLMRDKTEELFRGIFLINRVLQAGEIVLSIEKQNKELLDVFSPFLSQPEYKNIRVAILPNQYPQGGELQLIKSVTGKELARGVVPKDEGLMVSNVGTIHAVYNALVERKPLTERIITVSGEQSKKSGNYQVKIGTPISHILEYQNLTNSLDDKQLVLGGPMMGKNVVETSAPIIKGSSGVLFFKKKEIKRNNCISCGYCVDVCPMKLMPLVFAENYRTGKIASLEKYSLNSCIECAACEYICPSDVPLMESIKEGKVKLKALLTHAN